MASMTSANFFPKEAVILAGGKGSRLRSEVDDVPKPMASVDGKPFLEYLLRKLKFSGVESVVISVGYMREKIMSHFNAEWEGLQVHYCVEETPLGTGGGLAAALKCTSVDHVIVLNGDSYVADDFRQLVSKCVSAKSDFGVLVRKISDTGRYGVCQLQADKLIGFERGREGQPGFINAGVYYASRDLLTAYSEAFVKYSLEDDFLPLYVRNNNVIAVETTSEFIDIGVPESYRRAQIELPRFVGAENDH